MRSIEFSKLFMAIAACAALSLATIASTPSVASAQCTGSACTPVRPDGKGMIGLGLIGGEIGLIVLAIIQNAAHTNEWWPYLVFPLIGIGAGIGGGYALEVATGGWGSTSQNLAEVDIGIMIGGAVLIVPAIIGTLALASWTPPAESATGDDDMAVDDEPSGDSVEAVQDESSSSAAPDTSSSSSSGSSDTSTTSSSTGPTSMIGGPGLIRMDADSHSLAIGVPMVGAVARYASEELSSLHLIQQYDVNVPLVSGTF